MRIKATWLATCLVNLALVGQDLGAEPALQRFEFVETHMGSSFHVILYTSTEPAASQASRAAFARIAALDAALSDYNPESELMKLCDQAGGPPVRVSADLFEVLDRSLALSERSEGAFDVTVGPVVRLWRRSSRTRTLPDPETLARARSLVGYQNVRLDREARTVQLLKAGMKLDLGGIAKGYAAQAAINVLKEQGIDCALVAGAGDIVISGPPPDADGWTIGIAPLEKPQAEPQHHLLLEHAAVSTSGDTERFVEIDGKRYSHIVDPRTGIGLVDRMTITVVAPDGPTADSLGTAACVLGPEQGLALIDATKGSAAFVMRATKEGLRTTESKRWHAVPNGKPDH
jgi:FAD:protein FMN transferase